MTIAGTVMGLFMRGVWLLVNRIRAPEETIDPAAREAVAPTIRSESKCRLPAHIKWEAL
jgi:hypothetical protein